MIFTKIRDPRLITVRRGGTLLDSDHHLLALWAADCAQHVLHFFEEARPGDDRPRRALELVHGWAEGRVRMSDSRMAAFAANAAARDLSGAAREAAHSVGQAAAVPHVAAHEAERVKAGRLECQWQRAQLPAEIRELVLDDQRLRNELCWLVFDC